jgi:phosphopantetheinyl transferase
VDVFVATDHELSSRSAQSDDEVLDCGVGDREKALAMGSMKRRAQFLAGRRLLWRGLHTVFGTNEVSGWRIDCAATGQPILVARNGGGTIPVRISLAHSAHRVACAVGKVAALGIDLEVHKARDWTSLGAEAFSSRERNDLDVLQEPRRSIRAYELWCMKEALLKALGIGLSVPLAGICISNTNRVADVTDGRYGQPERWRFDIPFVSAGVTCVIASYRKDDGETRVRMHTP